MVVAAVGCMAGALVLAVGAMVWMAMHPRDDD